MDSAAAAYRLRGGVKDGRLLKMHSDVYWEGVVGSRSERGEIGHREGGGGRERERGRGEGAVAGAACPVSEVHTPREICPSTTFYRRIRADEAKWSNRLVADSTRSGDEKVRKGGSQIKVDLLNISRAPQGGRIGRDREVYAIPGLLDLDRSEACRTDRVPVELLIQGDWDCKGRHAHEEHPRISMRDVPTAALLLSLHNNEGGMAFLKNRNAFLKLPGVEWF